MTPTIAQLKTKVATAQLLSISKRSLDRLRESGAIRAVRVGGRVMFADLEIQNFINRNLETRKERRPLLTQQEGLQ